MDREYSKYQQKVIKNYYDNREAISVQRLGELVTELYLAEGILSLMQMPRTTIAVQRLQELVTELYLAEGKARAARWKQITAALEGLKVPLERIEHLRKKDDPALVAKLVDELLAK